MRFTEVICLSVILALFSTLFTGAYRQVFEMDRKLEKLEKNTDSLIFISGSFTASCNGKGFSSFDEWEKACKSMWQLESIGWEYVGESVPEPGNQIYQVYRGNWKGPYGCGEVFSKRKVSGNETDNSEKRF